MNAGERFVFAAKVGELYFVVTVPGPQVRRNGEVVFFTFSSRSFSLHNMSGRYVC